LQEVVIGHNSIQIVTSSPLEYLFKSDRSAGTLWWVKETLWANQLPSFYNPKGPAHPGLSILNEQKDALTETVPVLHGTSSSKGPIVVKGVSNHSKDFDENSKTYFGRILTPAKIPNKTIEEFDQATLVFNPNLGASWHKEFDVIPNRYKSKITQEEQEQLEMFLSKKMSEDE
jgi:hypothetical protein